MMLIGYNDDIESKVGQVNYQRIAIVDPKPGAPAMGKCAGQVVLFVFEYLFGVD